ncbi:MAG: hypothetical protein RL748_3604 [Pseudomonadota bacterium]|jgi:hypothetical protein
MSEFLRHYRLIWRYTLQYRQPPMSKYYLALCFALTIPGFIVGFGKGKIPGAAIFALSLPLFFWAVRLWCYYCTGVIALVTPDSASLAPNIHHHARRAILLNWFLLTTLAALLMGQYLLPFWWSFWGAGTVLFAIGCLALRKELSAAAWAIIPLWLQLYYPLPQTVGILIIYFLILALAWAYFYPIMLQPENGANKKKPTQQAAMPQSRAKLLQQAFAKHAPQAQLSDLLGAGSFLRGSIRIGSQEFNHILLVPVVIGWMAKLVFWPDSANSQHLLGQIILIILALIQLTGINPFLSTIERTRTEQALFRLSPLAPAAHQFNRMLAQHFVRAGMINWLYVTLLFMLYSTLFGISGQILLAQFAACSIRLHKIAAPLCNYAALRNSREHQPIETISDNLRLLSMCFILALIAWYVLGSISPPPVWTHHFLLWWSSSLLIINVIHTARILPWRWRMMVAAPVAFPAGRLDD